MGRMSLFSAAATLALLAAPLVTPASAGQHNSAPTRQSATSNGFAYGGNAGALSLNNNAVDQSNLRFGGRKGPGFQSNSAPTVSTALSTALSVGGDGSATGVNTNMILQDNEKSGRKSPTIQLNSAPTVQAAVGTAVSIGGNASAAAANSNSLSQDNLH